jgi:branched-chain amino acid aminotransferase
LGVVAEYVFIDDRMLPLEGARIPVVDRGLLYGEGVFDTMRAYNGEVFRFRQHLERFLAGAQSLGLQCPLDFSALGSQVETLLKANQLADAYIRLTLTRGDGGFGMEALEGGMGRLFIVARALASIPKRIYEQGITAVVSRIRRNETSPLSGIKSLNFLDNLLARREAKAVGADESILLNTRSNVAEASSSNVFLVMREDAAASVAIITPDRASGVLPGITREAVLEVAAELQLAAAERPVAREELFHAREVFITNSIRGIVPIVKVDGHSIGDGAPGAATVRLMEAYRRLAQRNLSMAPLRRRRNGEYSTCVQ